MSMIRALHAWMAARRRGAVRVPIQAGSMQITMYGCAPSSLRRNAGATTPPRRRQSRPRLRAGLDQAPHIARKNRHRIQDARMRMPMRRLDLRHRQRLAELLDRVDAGHQLLMQRFALLGRIDDERKQHRLRGGRKGAQRKERTVMGHGVHPRSRQDERMMQRKEPRFGSTLNKAYRSSMGNSLQWSRHPRRLRIGWRTVCGLADRL
jgi:hypothetical protein